jgi:flagellar biosynthesis protein FliR
VISTLFDSLAQALPEAAMLRSWLLGAARVMPAMIIVPAFGLRAVPAGARLALALCLGICVSPVLAGSDTVPFVLAVTLQALRGMPVAVAAAAALWAASMAGGLIDELGHSRERSQLPLAPAGGGAASTLFAMVAAIAFLETGGPSRIVTALTRPSEPLGDLLTQVVRDLLAGVQVAVAVAVPFLVASVFFDVLTNLIARTVQGISLQSLWAPLRTLFFLLLLAAMLDRVLALIVLQASRAV